MDLLKEYKTEYRQVGKHRKKCLCCGKLIADQEPVVMQLYQKTKYYPVRGLMAFSTWYALHEHCLADNH